jgi:hypothetical protein
VEALFSHGVRVGTPTTLIYFIVFPDLLSMKEKRMAIPLQHTHQIPTLIGHVWMVEICYKIKYPTLIGHFWIVEICYNIK